MLALGILVLGARMPLLYDIQQRLEWFAYDLRMRLNLPGEVEFDPQVVIVDIDEKSLAAEGQWPWSRRRIGDLMEAITGAGAAVIAFDSTFPEAERNPVDLVLAQGAEVLGPEVQQALDAARESMDGDLYLSTVLAANPVVLGFSFTSAEVAAESEPPTSSVTYRGDLNRVSFLQMQNPIGNLPVLQQAAVASGFFTVLPDADGVIRRVPTVVRHGDTLYPSLAVEAMRLALGGESVEVFTEPVGDTEQIDHISIDGILDIPTDGEGQVIVPFKGRSPTFLYLSATDVLNGAVDASAMEGSVVLIGTTAEGLKDLRATPVGPVYPGVEVHATTISALFGEGFPVRPSWALGADVALLAVSGVAAILLFARLGLLASIVAALLLLGAVASLNFWLWSAKHLVLSLAAPMLSLLVIIFIYLGFRFIAEARSRRSLKEAFGQYVPATLVEEMYQDPEKDFGFEGESREMSVLFSDIRGFTKLSEQLDPQGLKQFLNAYFTPITEIIFRNQGTIDKYVGDMVMAFWGAPLRDQAHAQHAVETALGMLAALPAMREEFRARGWPDIVGIGINTGPMNVGDMGSSFRRAYTVIGDSVNLGSRLESLTKFYGVKLLVSDTTRAAVKGVVFRRLDRVRVKGKTEPIEIHEAACLENDLQPALGAELRAHEAAMDAYFAGDWDTAAARFGELAAAHPARAVYPLFVSRVNELRQHAGPGWDGVYSHASK
ncbi:MAG: CHASE2 domain-containing protein [Gammaproteobacteria bacterium]